MCPTLELHHIYVLYVSSLCGTTHKEKESAKDQECSTVQQGTAAEGRRGSDRE